MCKPQHPPRAIKRRVAHPFAPHRNSVTPHLDLEGAVLFVFQKGAVVASCAPFAKRAKSAPPAFHVVKKFIVAFPRLSAPRVVICGGILCWYDSGQP